MNGGPREPVRKPWIWVVVTVVLLASIPWYLPAGSTGFVLLGIPAWMLLSVVFTLIMCGFVSWLCFTQWDVVEGEEEAEEVGSSGGPSGRDYAGKAQGSPSGSGGE